MPRRRPHPFVYPVVLAAAKAAVSIVALALGFRAISDDDYARVVIAEQWAHAPKLDPSGTSWLPFPFWVNGMAMLALGRSVGVARGVAFLIGVISVIAIYRSALWIGEAPRAAFAAALLAAVFPWSARLGVATVPELFTASITLLAVAAFAKGGRALPWGGVAILVASLSRYEAWPVAAAFAVASLTLAGRRVDRFRAIGAAALGAGGPLIWLLWNNLRYGDALRFFARVVAYKRAIGAGDTGSARLGSYLALLVREEPELLVLLAGSLIITLGGWARRSRATFEAPARGRPLLRPYLGPAVFIGLQLAALSLAQVRDGAPTQHPERVLLTTMIFVACLGGACVAALIDRGQLGSVAALALATAITAGVGWRFRPHEAFVDRAGEVAIGEASRSVIAPSETVLVEVVDYGYLAVSAAFGRPEHVIPDRSIDPREAKVASSFGDSQALSERIAATGATWVIGRTATANALLGPPSIERGGFGLWRTKRALPMAEASP